MDQTDAEREHEHAHEHEHEHEVECAITINGELAVVPHEEVSYAEVVAIAYPVIPPGDVHFTVAFRNAKSPRREGHLVEGQVIVVRREGTEFDVYDTVRS